MTTKVYLIRHGQTLWNQDSKYQGHSDIALSETGKEQAQRLREYFVSKNIELNAIYASDLSRAHQTAEIIAGAYNMSVSVNKDFREMNFGVWEGLTFKEIQKLYTELAEQWLKAPENLEIPNGESFLIVKDRAERALQSIIQKHENENIVLVSHGGTLRTIFCALLDIPLTKMWQFKLDNTAVTIFDFYKDKPILSLYNSTAHLY